MALTDRDVRTVSECEASLHPGTRHELLLLGACSSVIGCSTCLCDVRVAEGVNAEITIRQFRSFEPETPPRFEPVQRSISARSIQMRRSQAPVALRANLQQTSGSD
jgi:hypothetical protein